MDAARLLEAARLLGLSSRRVEIQRRIIEAIDENLAPSSWFLFLLVDDKSEMHCEIAVGKRAQAFKDARVRVGQGIAGWVAEHSEPLVLSNLKESSDFFSEIEEMKHLEGVSVVAVPLLLRKECLGVLQLVDCADFDAEHESNLATLREFAGHAAAAIETSEREHKLVELAIADDSTGLYKAHHLDFILDTELDRSARYGYNVSLVFLECQHFQDIASSLRGPAMSRLLSELGDLIKSSLRRIDWAFYLGDGKFALTLPQASKENANVFASRLRNFIESTSWLAPELNIRLIVAAGAATSPTDTQAKLDLIRLADQALR